MHWRGEWETGYLSPRTVLIVAREMQMGKWQTLFTLLKHKGLRYTYNRVHYHVFWEMRNPLITRLLHWLQPYPTCIEVEVTTRCNLQCIICEHTFWNEPSKDMTLEQFKGIIDQFPGLKWIGLTGIGESFLNRDFMAMLRYVKSKDIVVELYDTFYFIDEKITDELIDMEVDRILISLDAATKETYEKIRVNSDFDRVTSNLKRLYQVKYDRKKLFPSMAFHFIINKLNWSEIPAYIDYVKSIVGDQKTFIQYTRMLHRYKHVEHLFTEVPDEIVRETEEKAKSQNISVGFNRDVLTRKPSITCCMEWTMPFIFVTGHVIPCCVGNEAGQREFQKETSLGNIFEQPFREIWNGEKYRNLRKQIRQGKVPPPCVTCSLYDLHPEREGGA